MLFLVSIPHSHPWWPDAWLMKGMGAKCFTEPWLPRALSLWFGQQLGVAFYNSTGGLAAALKTGGPGGVVYDVSFASFGQPSVVFLAMIGVIACPITSGDTAFRSARLTLADWFKLEQVKNTSRLYLAVPLIAVGAILSQMNFAIIWRYFAWTNQTLAIICSLGRCRVSL